MFSLYPDIILSLFLNTFRFWATAHAYFQKFVVESREINQGKKCYFLDWNFLFLTFWRKKNTNTLETV